MVGVKVTEIAVPNYGDPEGLRKNFAFTLSEGRGRWGFAHRRRMISLVCFFENFYRGKIHMTLNLN